MHLKNRPTYFIKNGVRKPVYYSVDARQLLDTGWVEEGVTAASKPVNTPSVEPVKSLEVEAESPSDMKAEPNLDEMTRAELIEFAEANSIEFKSYASKSEILEACKEFVNG